MLVWIETSIPSPSHLIYNKKERDQFDYKLLEIWKYASSSSVFISGAIVFIDMHAQVDQALFVTLTYYN